MPKEELHSNNLLSLKTTLPINSYPYCERNNLGLKYTITESIYLYLTGTAMLRKKSTYKATDVYHTNTNCMSKVNTMKTEWNKRLNILKHGCRTKTSHIGALHQKQNMGTFYQSKKANFTLCKVPKSGSTFWAAIYLILEKEHLPESIIKKPRSNIHGLSGNIDFKRLDKNANTFNIIVARNPYTRLFSAYIDKLFLLGFPSIARRASSAHQPYHFYTIDKGLTFCGFNVSFEDFLDHITTRGLAGNGINPHWSPVSLMCHACEINYNFVALQDTLTVDSEHVINDVLDIPQAKKESLNMMFHGQEGINKTIRGIIHTLMSHQAGSLKICPDSITHLRKLWFTFKIQGYIRKDLLFPLEAFRYGKHRTNPSKERVAKVILDTMAQYPMSRRAKKKQRKEYLISAYKGISRKTIRRIQLMYEMDFKLFNFNKNPPNILKKNVV